MQKNFEPIHIPDVAADCHDDFQAVDLQCYSSGTGQKVAGFVEDAVVGQQALVINLRNFTIGDDGGAVVAGVVGGFCETDDCCCLCELCRETVYGCEVFFEEVFFVEQVFRRVAAEAEFRKNDKLRAGFDGAVIEAFYFFGVALKVADRRIDLCQRYTHLKSLFNSVVSSQ